MDELFVRQLIEGGGEEFVEPRQRTTHPWADPKQPVEVRADVRRVELDVVGAPEEVAELPELVEIDEELAR